MEPDWKSQEAFLESWNTPDAPTAMDAIGAAFHESQSATPTFQLLDFLSTRAAKQDGQVPLSGEDATARYPDMKFSKFESGKEYNPTVAQMIYDHDKERQENERLIEEGPKGLSMGLAKFGVGALAYVMDPIATPIDLSVGFGVGGLLAKTAWGARAAAHGAPALSRLGLSAVENVAGGAAGAAVQEIGNITVDTEQGIKYNAAEGATNFAVNALVGTTFGMALREGGHQVARLLRDTNAKLDAAVISMVTNQAEHGITPLPSIVLEAAARETDVPGNYTHLSTGERPFYVPSNPVASLDGNEARPVSERFGTGIQMTDDLNKAHAAGGRDMESGGKVFEVDAGESPFSLWEKKFVKKIKEIDLPKTSLESTPDEHRQFVASDIRAAGKEGYISKEVVEKLILALDEKVAKLKKEARAKFFGEVKSVEDFVKVLAPDEAANLKVPSRSSINALDLNQPIPEDARGAFDFWLQAMGVEPEAMEALNGIDVIGGIREAIDRGLLPEKALVDIENILKQSGYAAYLHDGTNVHGVKHSPHNILEVFDTTKIKEKGSTKADKSKVRQVTPEETKKAQDYNQDVRNQSHIDGDLLDKSERTLADETDHAEEIDDEDFFGELDSMREQGLLEDGLADEAERIRAADNEANVMKKLINLVVGCVRG